MIQAMCLFSRSENLLTIVLLLVLFSCSYDNEVDESAKKAEMEAIGRELGFQVEFIDDIDISEASRFKDFYSLKRKLGSFKSKLENVSTYLSPNPGRLKWHFQPDCDIISVGQKDLGSVTLNFTVNYQNPIGILPRVNSFLTGWELGLSYKQQSYHLVNHDKYKINVLGKMSYVVFFEGAGTVYSYLVGYQLKIAPNCEMFIETLTNY